MIKQKIAVIGLGYVGLPLVLALARVHHHVIGYDLNEDRIAQLKSGADKNGQVNPETLASTHACFTSQPAGIEKASVYIVTVPVPITDEKKPDFRPLIDATSMIGALLKKGDIVIYESTVPPGTTEDICGTLLCEISGLKRKVDFKIGYSPERINLGDNTNTLEKIVKVIAAEDEETLYILEQIYGPIIEAGVYLSNSIKAAEMAKLIENTQRDLNIALVNELAIICDRLNIPTHDVLQAAATKWNFMPFSPGLVGGPCIGAAPYHLAYASGALEYQPEIILAGRRVNDGMGLFIAEKTKELLAAAGKSLPGSRVAILGLAYKENVADSRNSRTVDIVRALQNSGVHVLIYDPLLSPHIVLKEHGISLAPLNELTDLDALIVAVAHQHHLNGTAQMLLEQMPAGSVVVDIRSILSSEQCANHYYWSL